MPASIGEFPKGQTFISLGKEYEVHAMVVFQGKISVQIVDDLRMINWYPAWFFEVCESALPNDWICNLFDGEPAMIIGPKFVAKDIDSYAAMVELEDDLVQQFWRRLDAQNEAKS